MNRITPGARSIPGLRNISLRASLLGFASSVAASIRRRALMIKHQVEKVNTNQPDVFHLGRERLNVERLYEAVSKIPSLEGRG
jgi:hypothetical protein